MRIAIASDHGGFAFKQELEKYLRELGYEVENFGCHDEESCDYPDFGIPAAKSVVRKKNEKAILVCTNGIGMCMLANKIEGIRAALVYSKKTAAKTRQHHNSNILCLGGKEFPFDELKSFVKIWLETDFEGGRHERRVNKINALDDL
ncbi:MAG: ribose 5-phosphate isomerase B [Candidatus Auribacterota bacterium]|nr:ribose 5-phosphate isomerase B [Candidatus Auribacterota bacterium]